VAGRKVLIIDDESKLVSDIDEILRGSGDQLIVARDEAHGTMVAHREKPDLIVLGLNLTRNEGVKILTDLSRSVDTMLIPVIFIGPDNPIEESEMMKMGAVAYFKRPFKTEDLLAEIKKYTGG